MGWTYTVSDPNLTQGSVGGRQISGPNMAVRVAIFDAGHRFDPSIGPNGSRSYTMGSETEFVLRVMRNVLQPAAEKAGLGRVTWHQFRHIHSSLLNDLKVPVKIAQELGHASISTTLNIYTHVVDASHRKAVEAVEERLFGEMGCCGLKSSTTVDQPQPTSAFSH